MGDELSVHTLRSEDNILIMESKVTVQGSDFLLRKSKSLDTKFEQKQSFQQQSNAASIELRKHDRSRIQEKIYLLKEEKRLLHEAEKKDKADAMAKQHILRKFTKMFKTDHELKDWQDKD